MRKWMRVQDFPKYEVSFEGVIRNISTGRRMAQNPNQFGDLTVGLSRNGKQYTRSVKVIVAKAFVPGQDMKFNTAMLLDGNKNNVHSANIVWRPRWLAWEYTHQFENPRTYYDNGPIVDRAGNEYPTILDCSMQIGSLCKDIMRSIREGTMVFPGGEVFSLV